MVAELYLQIFYSILVVVAAGLVGELLISVFRGVGERMGGHLGQVRLIRQVIRLTWVTLAALGVLTIWGVASDTLTAVVVGVVALVISLSLQSTFQNMISGVFLLKDGALRVGDHIEHFWLKGEVVRVALRNTWVRTETGDIAVVGNMKLADGPTLNHDLAPRFVATHDDALFRRPRRWYHAPQPDPTTDAGRRNA